MKQLFFVFLSALAHSAKASGTLHVVTHNKETIVTDPSKGFNEYKRRGVIVRHSAIN